MAAELQGSSRRIFMAKVVKLLSVGGQRFAEDRLGWNRTTIRKGDRERRSRRKIKDRFGERGRHPVEVRLPTLSADIRAIVEPHTQVDATFRSAQIYTPLTAAEVQRRLQSQCGYRASELPTERTLRTKLNALGYRLKRVRKCRPLKKSAATDAIFKEVHRVNKQADADPQTVRISLDSKAVVKIGDFSRGGLKRCAVAALDHDFAADATVTPFGMLLPGSGDSHVWFGESRVTADFMVDRLHEVWPRLQAEHQATTLVLNADNGPESNGQRTQWLKRLVEFSDQHQVTVQLAYYPPYHSKYNPVERLWGVLENHWRGELLSSVDKAVGLARSMTYRGIRPMVKKIKTAYAQGVTVAKDAMRDVEARLQRKPGLEKWFITILPQPILG